MITYQETVKMTDESLRMLYDSVGWWGYTRRFADMTVLLEQAEYVIAAYDDEQLVGLIRTIGDGYYVVLIQDILVLPSYQGRGIGSELLKRLMDKVRTRPQIYLVTDPSEENQAIIDWYIKRRFASMGDSVTHSLGMMYQHKMNK